MVRTNGEFSTEPFSMGSVFGPELLPDISQLKPCYRCGSPAMLDISEGWFSIWCSNFIKCKSSPGTRRYQKFERCEEEWKQVNRMSVCEVGHGLRLK